MKNSQKYSYIWVTGAFFLLTLLGHWFFGWQAYQAEQESFGLPIDTGEYTNMMLRDMLENWQSEFLQLIWQVAGLSFLLYVGSPQSKEGDERKEEKLDLLLRAVKGKEADKAIKDLDRKYPRK